MENVLAEIQLSDKQVKAVNEQLNKWKEKKSAEISEEVRSDYETKFGVKLRQLEEEKHELSEHYETVVEEIKDKMQKVMVKRFSSALKGVYDELKVEARKDVLNDPRIIGMEEVKNIVFPLLDETVTKGYSDELAKTLRMLESREDAIDRLKAKLKLKDITSKLTPAVREAVEAFIGEAETEEEVVEKYSKLKNLVKSNTVSEDGDGDAEDIDYDQQEYDEYAREKRKFGKGRKKKTVKEAKDDDDDEDDEPDDDEDDDEEEEKKGKKKKKSKKSRSHDDDDDLDWGEDDDDDEDDEDEDEDEDEEKGKGRKKKGGKKSDEDDEMEEELEINPSFSFERSEKKTSGDDYENTLNEMLNLAGVPTD
jgi:hypothetical protein